MKPIRLVPPSAEDVERLRVLEAALRLIADDDFPETPGTATAFRDCARAALADEGGGTTEEAPDGFGPLRSMGQGTIDMGRRMGRKTL